MKGSDITVVIPAHNAGRFICETLDGIAAQTVRPAGVIVVNNASTDDTGERLEDWKSRNDLDLRVIETGFGDLANARNIGFCSVATELIAMLDADDIYMPDFLERAVGAFNEVGDLCLFFGNKLLFNENGAVDEPVLEATPLLALAREDMGENTYIVGAGLFEALLNGNFISPSGAVLRRSVAYKARLFTPRLPTGEDRDFFCRLALQGPAAYTLAPVVRYRIHAASIMNSSGMLKLRKNNYRSLVALLMDFDSLDLNDRQRQAIEEALQKLAHAILYHASKKGLAAYRREKLWLRRVHGHSAPAVRSFLRAAYRSVMKSS